MGVLLRSGGGQFTRRSVALTHDGELAVACKAERICIYSTLSGELLFEMKDTHEDEVTSVCLHPKAASKVYSSSRDGTIKLWNLDDASCMATWEVPQRLPVESMTIVGDLAYLTCSWRGEEAGRAMVFDLLKGEAREVRVKLSTPRPIVSSVDSMSSNSVVATHDRHTILVWDAHSFGAKSPLALHHTKAFTCVAVSPDGLRIAAGDVTGRIMIWHDIQEALSMRSLQEEEDKKSMKLNDEDDKPWAYVEPPAATVHWHAHAVGCVTFSQDGRYLLSGGQEAVLVLWDVRTGARAYLPRLGGALVGISSCKLDAAKYAIRQVDNTIRIVNTASMIIECSIHGIRPAPCSLDYPSIVFEGYSGKAVVSGPHGVLQFFDISRDLHVDKLQLSKRNIVSMSDSNGEEVNISSLDPTVRFVAFSSDGNTLATVESRPGASGADQNSILKFWNRCSDGEKQYGSPYILNTLSENPHRSSSGNYSITGLAFNSKFDIVGTCSDSGDFILWKSTIEKPLADREPKKTWRKAAIIPGHHGNPLTSIAFASDGSLIAVSSDVAGCSGVSLWWTSSCSFAGELPAGLPKLPHVSLAPKMDRLFFLPQSPILVLISSSGIVVYNVISLSVVWCASLEDILDVAVDSSSQHWAIVVGKKKCKGPFSDQNDESGIVILFNYSDDRPKAGWVVRRQHSSLEKPPVLNPATKSGHTAKPSSCGRIEIAFVPAATKAYKEGRNVLLPGCSPLVVFSQDREFSLARHPEMDGIQSFSDIDLNNLYDQVTYEKRSSGYMEVFGHDSKYKQINQPDVTVAGSVKVTGMFDAPSHALPPMSTLCKSFLEHLLE